MIERVWYSRLQSVSHWNAINNIALSDLRPVHKRVCAPLQQHPVTNVFLHPHWHSAEPAPHHLNGLNNLPHIETGFFISSSATLLSFSYTILSHKRVIEMEGELLVAKLLIVNISTKTKKKRSHVK